MAAGWRARHSGVRCRGRRLRRFLSPGPGSSLERNIDPHNATLHRLALHCLPQSVRLDWSWLVLKRQSAYSSGNVSYWSLMPAIDTAACLYTQYARDGGDYNEFIVLHHIICIIGIGHQAIAARSNGLGTGKYCYSVAVDLLHLAHTWISSLDTGCTLREHGTHSEHFRQMFVANSCIASSRGPGIGKYRPPFRISPVKSSKHRFDRASHFAFYNPYAVASFRAGRHIS